MTPAKQAELLMRHLAHNPAAVPYIYFYNMPKNILIHKAAHKKLANLAITSERHQRNYHHIVKQTQRQKGLMITLWSSCLLSSSSVGPLTITVLYISSGLVSSGSADVTSREYNRLDFFLKSSRFFPEWKEKTTVMKMLKVTRLSLNPNTPATFSHCSEES